MSSTTEGSVVLQDFEVTIRVVTEEWNPLYADQSSQFYTNLSIAYYTFLFDTYSLGVYADRFEGITEGLRFRFLNFSYQAMKPNCLHIYFS
uniref:Uncharacterized protein n=1 Tax=Magallana gigas TaxID=29159 RepID=K1PMV0_MAGGI